jgi:hypothetical protein
VEVLPGAKTNRVLLASLSQLAAPRIPLRLSLIVVLLAWSVQHAEAGADAP